jgi:surfeit locus 1 family protein
MTVRTAALVAVSAVMAIVCIRLGVWQLSRLSERRARNAVVAERLTAAPVGLEALPADTGQLRNRRVRVRGRLDLANEIVVTGRTRNGSPGVHIVTPLRVAGRDTAVLVNRGWVYSPNSAEVDLTAWREPDSLDAAGFVEPLSPGREGDRAAASARSARLVRRLDRDALARELGYPIAPYVVTLLADSGSTQVAEHPVRLPTPALDEGAHMSYAIQWFAFATIAIVGAGVYVRKAGG